MFVRAAEGRQVRRPDTLTLLRPEGEEVPDDDFWFRRVSEGDVVRQTRPDASPETEPEKGAPAPAKSQGDLREEALPEAKRPAAEQRSQREGDAE